MRCGCWLLTICIPIGLSGCGTGASEELAQVSGVITYEGKPLANADVYFRQENLEGYGRTDDQGRFSLVRGAPIGECQVYITKTDIDLGNSQIDLSQEGMDEEQLRAMQGGGANRQAAKSLLPPKYCDPAQTELRFTVPPDGTTEANFQL